ncbi:MAG: hypothetical protein JXA01_09290 [Dehalococcoidia bacterium]|nr:hypothetical protein [Dehalococcoidia bacterium]
MSRYINESITVHISRELKPTAFIWRKRLYRVIEILSWWHEPAEWWNGESIRTLMLVSAECDSPGIYELCKSSADWSLRRLLD